MPNKSKLIHALTTLSTAVVSELDFSKICQIAAQQACSLLNCDGALVPILNDDLTEYTYLAGFGENTDEIVGESLTIDFGVCGWVFKHKKPWWKGVLDDLMPNEKDMWEAEANNMLLVPLVGKTSFLGGISCFDKKGGFDQNDLELLNIIATPIALALENSLLVKNLEDTVKSRTSELMTEKEKAEQANHTKSEFLANISHELRTPMHAILSYSAMGKDNIATVDKDRLFKYFNNINASGERLLMLLNDLLDLSKLEAGKMEFFFSPASMQELIEDAIVENEALSMDKKIRFKFTVEVLDAYIFLDRNKIIQVLNNLLSNAIKFSESGSEISILLVEQQISIDNGDNTTSSVHGLAVSVADNGIGIPEKELDAVFDKFIQSSNTKSKAGGTGLGLSICKKIIAGHKGVIYATNKDKGVIFTFALPRENIMEL